MAQPINDALVYAPVTHPYRRWVAWALAILLHLVLIGAVASWRLAPTPPEAPPRPSLDVVLVGLPGEAPEQAEAIAAAAQQARGRDAEPAPRARAQAAAASASAGGAERAAPAPETLSGSAPDAAPAPARAEPLPPGSFAAVSEAAGGERGRQARDTGPEASLAGEEDELGQLAAREAAEARYIAAWTRQVEAFGNRHYRLSPALEGQLRIRVVVGREGQLRQIEVVQSSGHPELDQAALTTVRDAGPYPPFDGEMAGLDSLSITRVWRFGKGNDFGVP
ncbi:energy transducer TonB [Halomonas sp. 328]|uniref:energy transducer TonB n=1 Tax=Halomonas sp. 328 TaxID=2776704 RepID=UPI0018A7E1A9|nr:energy transducer TonB [Halomonas sp. 328]MBF8222562.1 energy transducer TonB [Halomonas sp. 328]